MEVRVPAFAKLNLDLRVLYKRPDGYHELRSVFQTISLADHIDIRCERARKTEIRMAGNVEIADNLIVKAARLCLASLQVHAKIDFTLSKRIPMGAGLGGGSSDAASVLMALPGLLGRTMEVERSLPLAAQLGSDVPFFLLGGTAVVLGRGEELYPVPDLRAPHVLIVSPEVHVSTPEAYRALSARLSPGPAAAKLSSFQADLWSGNMSAAVNDFEVVVFEQHPRLKAIRNKLKRAGATRAMMTGSGSSIFGIFASRGERDAAARQFPGEQLHKVRFLSRRCV